MVLRAQGSAAGVSGSGVDGGGVDARHDAIRGQAQAPQLLWRQDVDDERSHVGHVRVGGLDQSIRIEMFGDLHEYGALGRAVTKSEALEAI